MVFGPARLRSLLLLGVASGLLTGGLGLPAADQPAAVSDESMTSSDSSAPETPAGPADAATSEAPTPPPEGLSLRAAVETALRNNRSLAKAALARETQRFDLRVAEDTFVPNLDFTTSTLYNPVTIDGVRTDTRSSEVLLSGRQRLPTGARVAIVWDTFRTELSPTPDTPDYSSSVYLQVDQPLLRGGGLRSNLAALRIARLAEKNSTLFFRDTVMATITSVIFSYRSLLQAKLQLQVAEAALQRAREQLRVNRALVDSGNLPPVEIIQSEADIASQEFNLLTARSTLDTARYALIRLLDVDRDAPLDPTDAVTIPEFTLRLGDAQALAYHNRPDFLELQHSRAMADLNRDVAKNNRLWDLSLNSHYNLAGDGPGVGTAFDRTFSHENEDWGVGLSLTIPFGDLTRQQSYLRARNNSFQAGIDLAEARDTIDIELRDAFRSIQLSRQRVRVAGVARELATSKLEIEKARLQSGQTTNFAIVTFQNDLVRARLNEISAQISYLNALTSLDETLGTTLKTWGIAIVELDDGGPPRTAIAPDATAPEPVPAP